MIRTPSGGECSYTKLEYWITKIQPRLEMISGWARSGLTDTQIAQALDISLKCLNRNMKTHNELREIIMDGREYAQLQIENALFKKAIGYKYVETTREPVKVYDENGRWAGEFELAVTKQVKKQQAPDTGAIIYWLEHRAPDRWQQKITAGDGEPIEITIKRKVWQEEDSDDEEEY